MEALKRDWSSMKCMKEASARSFRIDKNNKINMHPQAKALIYQLLCFATLFIASRFLLAEYTILTGFWIPLTAFFIGTFLSPKFQAVRTRDGDKLYMKWIFLKGIREIK